MTVVLFKRFFCVLLLLFLAVPLSGCNLGLPDRVEIGSLMMIRAIGIDKGEKDPNHICITLLSKEQTEQSGQASGGSGSTQSVILSTEAQTIFEAERSFQSYVDKRLFWGHIEYYLFGEEAAREGIGKYIDFITRDHDMRGTAKVYVVKGTTAKEFIQKSSTGDYFMPDKLSAIGENAKLFTGAQKLPLIEFLQWLNNKYSCAVAPILQLKPKEGESQTKEKPKEGESQTEEKPKEGESQTEQKPKAEGQSNEEKTPSSGDDAAMDIDLDGYAIFEGLHLMNLIDRKLARGQNFILNRVVTGVIQVKDQTGAMVGLDIANHKTKININFVDKALQGVTMDVNVASNINEIHSSSFRFTQESINFLEKEQSQVVKDEIEQVVKFAQENNLDFIDIANVFGVYHPVLWDKYKDQWDELFPTLPITVNVTSKIQRTYELKEPNGFFEEEHK